MLQLTGYRGLAKLVLAHGLVAPSQVGSSWTKDWTYVPALAGGFPNTGPPGKSKTVFLVLDLLIILYVTLLS